MQGVSLKESGLGSAGDLQDANAEDVDRAFLEWSAWCKAIGSNGIWDINWDSTEMRYCREAAYRVLGRPTLWGTWCDDAARYAAVLDHWSRSLNGGEWEDYQVTRRIFSKSSLQCLSSLSVATALGV